MKKFIIAATLGATMLTAAPLSAQTYQQRQDYQQAQRQYQQDVQQNRQDQREYRRALKDWRQARRYDYNRYEPGVNAYYADRYYRDGRYYRPYRLTRNDRIYRGQNGQYYCRRSDGTTGLIVGAAVGGLIGNSLDRGGSSVLGTLLGAGAGAALGSSIDRGQVNCR